MSSGEESNFDFQGLRIELWNHFFLRKVGSDPESKVLNWDLHFHRWFASIGC